MTVITMEMEFILNTNFIDFDAYLEADFALKGFH